MYIHTLYLQRSSNWLSVHITSTTTVDVELEQTLSYGNEEEVFLFLCSFYQISQPLKQKVDVDLSTFTDTALEALSLYITRYCGIISTTRSSRGFSDP